MLDNNKTVLALGYFDSVHKGHLAVLEKAKLCAREMGARLVVFTFGGNLKAFLKGGSEKSVYTPCERERLIKDFGAEEVFFAPVTWEFLGLDKSEFLQYLNSKYNVVCYVSGKDYRFGKGGFGDCEFLRDYAKEHKQKSVVVDTIEMDGKKISTTWIKELLADGNVKRAGELLGGPYSITGTVFSDRKIGRTLGFPTVNIKLDIDKFRLKDGVYKGRVIIDGKSYSAIINYGARPTFNLNDKLIETHLIDFNGDLYGQKLTVYFDAFMREVKKFSTQDQLKAQLQLDLKQVKDGIYD